jgi:ribokinase
VSAAHVIVVGSINADLVVSVDRLPAAGETVAGGRFSRHGGGKGANQAVAAARLGAKVTMVGAVGDDPFGEEAVTLLRDEGVDIASVAWLGATETGVALITVDAAGENQIAVASGANARLDGTAVEGLVAAAVAAGSARPVILLGHEVPETVVLAGARAASGATVVLNPAPARRLPDELLACRPILTPNASEASDLCDEREPEAAAAALAARSDAPVLVTLGARGVLLCSDGNAELLAAPAVDAVDTTGAGDAFNGALAAQLAAGRDVREAARFAVVAAALSTRAVGAREGMPRRGEVEAALA